MGIPSFFHPSFFPVEIIAFTFFFLFTITKMLYTPTSCIVWSDSSLLSCIWLYMRCTYTHPGYRILRSSHHLPYLYMDRRCGISIDSFVINRNESSFTYSSFPNSYSYERRRRICITVFGWMPRDFLIQV